MQRKQFIQSLLSFTAMTTLSSFKNTLDELPLQDQTMPVLFVGHGSPMNALEDNEFTKSWRKVAAEIPTPKAILMVSAHWETKGTFVTAMDMPKTIHDFGGFPQALFDVQYPAKGSKWLAEETSHIMIPTNVGMDQDWGLDHGAWSVLKHLYPNANIPVVQLSLDYTKDEHYHYTLAKQLQSLRKKGVLIIGSGNMVHNFQYATFSKGFNTHFGHDWAIEANEDFKTLIAKNDYTSLINFKKYSKALALSAPTPDHYLPMLYAIALRENNEQLTFFNDVLVGGSFSMTSLKIG
jgi:4,5-DOPA dioxygenase extradiol